jgi:putative sterol carrier protein
VFHIKNPDDTISEITATFNMAENPKAVLRLSMQDANLIIGGKESPINLFMSGKMKMEGDMAFAMKLQPLFVA